MLSRYISNIFKYVSKCCIYACWEYKLISQSILIVILNLFRDVVLSRRPLFFDDRSSKNGGKWQRFNELYQVSTIWNVITRRCNLSVVAPWPFLWKLFDWNMANKIDKEKFHGHQNKYQARLSWFVKQNEQFFVFFILAWTLS